MTDTPAASEFWGTRIKEAITKEIETIIDEEAKAASERVGKRIADKKAEIVMRAVERIKIMQKDYPHELRFEVVFSIG